MQEKLSTNHVSSPSARQNHNIEISNESFQNVAKSVRVRITATKEN
jgi:hypothetical protein